MTREEYIHFVLELAESFPEECLQGAMAEAFEMAEHDRELSMQLIELYEASARCAARAVSLRGALTATAPSAEDEEC